MAKTNREFLMLAESFVPGKHRTAGVFMSVKLDGQRCVWLPATRGVAVKHIPFSNRGKDDRNHVATGLWSRYGKVIHCPDYFVANFPNYPLDGELYMGRGTFQALMSTVRTLEPDEDAWQKVEYRVFDSPTYTQIFANGKINNPQWSKAISLADNLLALGLTEDTAPPQYFEMVYNRLKKYMPQNERLKLHEQRLLPFNTAMANQILMDELDRVVTEGGEGLMLRLPTSIWEPIRTGFLLKVKKLNDSEGTVVGYKSGEGKLLGLVGSVRVQWNGLEFDLSGFTDEERQMLPEWVDWARANPGQIIPGEASRFLRLGDVVTFRYRELSDSGVPKEARYWRRATL